LTDFNFEVPNYVDDHYLTKHLLFVWRKYCKWGIITPLFLI